MSSNAEQGRRLLELPALIAGIESQINMLRARQAALIAELDVSMIPIVELTDAVREEIAVACKIPDGQARTRVETARALATRLALTHEAMAAGRLSLEHAAAMARATHGLTVAESLWVETEVLDDPRAITPGQLGFRARQAAAKIHPPEPGERPAWLPPERALFATANENYTSFTWSLPTVDAAVVLTYLDATSGRQGRDDTRPGEERRADALLDLVRSALDSGTLPGGGDGRRPHLELIATTDALRDGIHHGAEINGTFVDSAALRELVCDADLTTTYLDGQRTVLDQGRTTRIVSARLRARLTARDGGCRFPGCPARPPRCRAHHIRHWADGGPTDLRNLLLLCERHHHAVHGGWTVHLDPDGTVTWTSPTGQHLSQPHHLQRLAEPEDLTDAELDWVRPMPTYWFEAPPPQPAPSRPLTDVCPF